MVHPFSVPTLAIEPLKIRQNRIAQIRPRCSLGDGAL